MTSCGFRQPWCRQLLRILRQKLLGHPKQVDLSGILSIRPRATRHISSGSDEEGEMGTKEKDENCFYGRRPQKNHRRTSCTIQICHPVTVGSVLSDGGRQRVEFQDFSHGRNQHLRPRILFAPKIGTTRSLPTYCVPCFSRAHHYEIVNNTNWPDCFS